MLPVGAGLFGIILGSATAGGPPEQVEVKVPGPTVTVEAEPVTKTVTKEVTPDACIDALDYAIEAIGLMQPLPEMIYESGMAGLEQDVPAIEDINNRLTTFSSDLEKLTPKVGEASQACRASAE
ncbi:hypothetical protein ACMX2H_16050 [Arthrobacter sulfonylureivorans]|uniref:hypothetical protein n=1 Tax=Arthrobacter sulfonylureivorans TaxID=2486855 RepID=UPI0039E69538